MSQTNTADSIRAQREAIVIVDDGAGRWAGLRDEVYAWLEQQGATRGYDQSTRVANTARLTADQYEDLCAETACLLSSCGSYGPVGVDPRALLDELSDLGAPTLHIG